MIMRSAGGYLICTICRSLVAINKDRQGTLSNPKIPFPDCGHTSIRELWPRWDILTVIDDTDLSSLEAQDAGPLKLVLYCSIFDFLFEDFLVNFLYKIKTPNELVDFILNACSDFPERLSLFKQVTGESLEEVFKNNNFSDFAVEFKILRENRNNFVHRTFEIDFEILAHCFEVVERNMLPAFVFLNNKYIKNSLIL